MYLRPLEPEDLDLLYTIENNEEFWDTSNTNGPYSRFALKQYIASAASIYECGQLRLVIDLGNNHDSSSKSNPIGLIDLTNYSAIDARAEIGITLLQKFRGKGWGEKALLLIESYAKKQLRIHSLHAYVSPNNLPSYQLFKKSGYKTIATLPDWCFKEGKYEDIALFMKIF